MVPALVAVDRLSLLGQEDGSAWCQSRAESGTLQGCSLLTVVKSLHLSPPGLWASCCSYLWIVPIASIRNGVEQDSYWLEDTKEGNPALPWWTAAPGPHSQPVAHVLGVTAALSGLPSSFYSPSGAAFFGPYSSATQPWASYQPSWAPSFHLCDEAKNIYPTDLRED